MQRSTRRACALTLLAFPLLIGALCLWVSPLEAAAMTAAVYAILPWVIDGDMPIFDGGGRRAALRGYAVVSEVLGWTAGLVCVAVYAGAMHTNEGG